MKFLVLPKQNIVFRITQHQTSYPRSIGQRCTYLICSSLEILHILYVFILLLFLVGYAGWPNLYWVVPFRISKQTRRLQKINPVQPSSMLIDVGCISTYRNITRDIFTYLIGIFREISFLKVVGLLNNSWCCLEQDIVFRVT